MTDGLGRKKGAGGAASDRQTFQLAPKLWQVRGWWHFELDFGSWLVVSYSFAACGQWNLDERVDGLNVARFTAQEIRGKVV